MARGYISPYRSRVENLGASCPRLSIPSRSMRWWFWTTVFTFFVLVIMPTWYHCGYGNCTKKFSTQQGCRRHRTSCKQAKVQWRKERAAYEAAAEPVIQDTVMADPGTPEPPEEPAAAPGPRRSSRLRRKPKPVPEIIPKVSEPVVPPATAAPNRSKYHTKPNAFGVFRVYHSPPTTNPDAGQTLDDVADAPSFTQSVGEEKRWWKGFGKKAKDKILAPFLNATVFRLFNWYYAATNFLSRAHLQRLVNEVLLAPDFKLADLVDFSVERELKRLDSTDPDVSPYAGTYGWTTSTLKIPLPCEGVKCAEGKAPVLELEGLVHRSLAEVIETAFSDSSSKSFHYTPFWEYWKPKPGAPPQRILSEVYTADVFLEEHERLGKMPRIPGDPDDLEYAIAAILIWSDSTHLANFGDASLWPIYIFFGNQSKYERGKPSMFAAHHLAYIPSLPKDLQEQYQAAFNGTPASSSTITHLQREVIQAVWNHLLSDPEFMKAYKDGIVVTCGDGRKRRLFPRFFFYSADYPENLPRFSILPSMPVPPVSQRRSTMTILAHWLMNGAAIACVRMTRKGSSALQRHGKRSLQRVCLLDRHRRSRKPWGSDRKSPPKTRSRSTYHPLASIFLTSSFPMFYTRWNLGYGREFLLTLSVFYIRYQETLSRL
ncbi:hypothetical protein BKA70DRAFT_856042 [Coprinopsis sp. MPI-PUGE-AT-0042]|nr:hypothetical protein BKA70DRAFT_856042 [Coprinopsis sp. MPI-PUGE-AT-0042]